MAGVLQAIRTALDAVENGVGVCVLGTGLTAAAAAVGFRLAGYRLGLTCQKREPERKAKRKAEPESTGEYHAVTMEEADANAAYADASVHWNAMRKQYEAAKLEQEADKLELDAERLREERRRFQEERVAELDAVRAARKAEKSEKVEKAARDAAGKKGRKPLPPDVEQALASGMKEAAK